MEMPSLLNRYILFTGKKQIDFAGIVIIYLLGNVFILLNQGVFWDDWALFNSSEEAIRSQFTGNGGPHVGYLHSCLLMTPHPIFIYKFLTIVFQLFSAYLLWGVFNKLKLESNFYKWVLLLSTIIPFFSAKNTMICFPYTLSYFIFLVGINFMLLSFRKLHLFYRAMALIFFFVSFTVNSYLIFYLIPLGINFLKVSETSLFEVFEKLKNPIRFVKLNFKYLFKSIDYCLLPIVFFVFKAMFLKPTGLYATGYNQISLLGLGKGVLLVPVSFVRSYVGVFKEIYSDVLNNAYYGPLFIIVLLALFVFYRKLEIEKSTLVSKKLIHIISIGVLFFFLGAYPYCVVGKLADFDLYNTRNQLLLPLGSALILVGSVFLLFRKQFINSILMIITSLFIMLNVSDNIQYIKGMIKQDALILFFKSSPEINKEGAFIYYDKSEELDASTREYGFYALNGMAKLAYGNQNKLICELGEYENIGLSTSWSKILEEGEKFNMRDYKPVEPNRLIIVDNGILRLNFYSTLRLGIMKLLNLKEYEKQVDSTLNICVMVMKYDQIKRLLYDKL